MVNTARAPRSNETTEGNEARILRAALELFSTKGFEGTGLRELAAAAGVNHSLVLYHFGSLEGVWKVVLGELVDDYKRRVRQRLAGLTAIDPATRLKVTMDLAGSYADIRDFIHDIEASPEFVVIDDVGLMESVQNGGSVRLTLQLSTYFRTTETTKP